MSIIKKLIQKMKKNVFKNFSLNFGPQHPAAHGVLRLIIELEGEIIKYADPHIGLLHRGTEKLIETKTFLQSIPYFDRLDYVSMMSQEHTYVLAIEKLLNIKISDKSSIIRVIFLEITRILNHLLAVTTHALDVGAMTPFLWGFEDRENLMEFYERVSGARMHSNFFRFGGLFADISPNLINDIFNFITFFTKRIFDIENLLSSSRIWKQRLVDIGIVSRINSYEYNLSGVLLRSTGIPWDLRILNAYEMYANVPFLVPIGIKGDCYDRYLIRIEELKQSCKIILFCIDILNSHSKNFSSFLVRLTDQKLQNPSRSLIKYSMEALINHFKFFSEGLNVPSEEVYVSTEAPKGEFGVYVVSNNSNKPYRCKIKSPGFYHLQSLNLMSFNYMIADLVTIIGTQDIVFGEVDR